MTNLIVEQRPTITCISETHLHEKEKDIPFKGYEGDVNNRLNERMERGTKWYYQSSTNIQRCWAMYMNYPDQPVSSSKNMISLCSSVVTNK